MILLSLLSSVLGGASWIRIFDFWALVTQAMAIKLGIWDNITG